MHNGAVENAEVIKEIRKICDIPICCELVPPLDLSYIELLVDAGVNSLMFNLELFDDKLRKKYCPGKGKIPKSKYLEALEFAVKLLGQGDVGSHLIMGLESPTSTLRGVKKFIEIGVKPLLVVFRPLAHTALEDVNIPEIGEVEAIVNETRKLMIDSGMSMKPGSAGCMSCSACYPHLDFKN